MELEAQIVRDTLRRMDMNRNSSLRAELRKRFIAEALVTKVRSHRLEKDPGRYHGSLRYVVRLSTKHKVSLLFVRRK